MKAKIDYTLYLIADEQYCHPHSLFDVVGEAATAGVSIIQYRSKSTALSDMRQQVIMLQRILMNTTVPLIINDSVELAHAVDAAGVHLGQDDGCVLKARELLGPDKIIGLSIRNEQELIAAQELPVDYLGLGPIFPTQSKADASKPIGLQVLQQAVQHSTKPIVAIGGINLENITQVYQAGVAGAAVLSAVCSHPFPARETRILREAKNASNS